MVSLRRKLLDYVRSKDEERYKDLIKRLENVFVDEVRIPIKKQYPRLIKIKTMKKVETSISKVEYHKEAF